MYTLKKSLGQHFLKDENICRKIVSALEEHKFNQLLEVGPGGGALTKYLLKIPAIDFKAVVLAIKALQCLAVIEQCAFGFVQPGLAHMILIAWPSNGRHNGKNGQHHHHFHQCKAKIT